eukprot:6454759-Ditylum_brightwellii.AAC.2
MVLLALRKMLEWFIPVIITSTSADTQGSLPLNPNSKMENDISNEDVMQKVIITLHVALSLFGVATARNEDAEKLQVFIAENYISEKYECQNLRSPRGSVINHRSTGIPNPKCGNGSKGQTRTPDMGFRLTDMIVN